MASSAPGSHLGLRRPSPEPSLRPHQSLPAGTPSYEKQFHIPPWRLPLGRRSGCGLGASLTGTRYPQGCLSLHLSRADFHNEPRIKEKALKITGLAGFRVRTSETSCPAPTDGSQWSAWSGQSGALSRMSWKRPSRGRDGVRGRARGGVSGAGRRAWSPSNQGNGPRG